MGESLLKPLPAGLPYHSRFPWWPISLLLSQMILFSRKWLEGWKCILLHNPQVAQNPWWSLQYVAVQVLLSGTAKKDTTQNIQKRNETLNSGLSLSLTCFESNSFPPKSESGGKLSLSPHLATVREKKKGVLGHRLPFSVLLHLGRRLAVHFSAYLVSNLHWQLLWLTRWANSALTFLYCVHFIKLLILYVSDSDASNLQHKLKKHFC